MRVCARASLRLCRVQTFGVVMSFDANHRGGFAPSRRRFVQGLMLGGAVSSLGLWPRTSWALKSPAQPQVLAGTEFDLVIGETPMNFTGRTRTAITVNGSLP